MSPPLSSILVTGGAGYVGAVLVPRLLQLGYHVRVMDAFIFGDAPLHAVKDHPLLELLQADIRDHAAVKRAVADIDIVIHLACISNDPSCELDPALSRSVNYDAFEPLLRESKASGVHRFIFASSSSVYGISDADDVTEDHPLRPLTAYNTYKAMCEEVLFKYESADFTTVAIRPGTICGCSPRQRLDLTVNALTCHAVETGRIKVFGGEQRRPSLHILDMIDLYQLLLELPAAQIGGRAFNAGYENLRVSELALLVKDVVQQELPRTVPIAIEQSPSDDVRSYHVCSDRIRRELGFTPARQIRDAVRSLTESFRQGQIPNPLSNDQYYNVRVLQSATGQFAKDHRSPFALPEI